MAKKSEIDSIITAVEESRFNDAHHVMTSSREPIRLQATLSLVFMCEAAFQIKIVAAELRDIRRHLLRGPQPSLP